MAQKRGEDVRNTVVFTPTYRYQSRQGLYQLAHGHHDGHSVEPSNTLEKGQRFKARASVRLRNRTSTCHIHLRCTNSFSLVGVSRRKGTDVTNCCREMLRRGGTSRGLLGTVDLLPFTSAEKNSAWRNRYRDEGPAERSRHFTSSTALKSADKQEGGNGGVEGQKKFRERRVPDGPFERAFAFGSLAAEIAVGAAGQMAKRSVAGPSSNGTTMQFVRLLNTCVMARAATMPVPSL
eukprot:3110419-Pyramimonas_sp.AAC.2